MRLPSAGLVVFEMSATPTNPTPSTPQPSAAEFVLAALPGVDRLVLSGVLAALPPRQSLPPVLRAVRDNPAMLAAQRHPIGTALLLALASPLAEPAGTEVGILAIAAGLVRKAATGDAAAQALLVQRLPHPPPLDPRLDAVLGVLFELLRRRKDLLAAKAEVAKAEGRLRRVRSKLAKLERPDA